MSRTSQRTTTANPPVKTAAQLPKPKALPPIVSLQKFLTDAYNAEKPSLEPAGMIINGFTLKNKTAAISIELIDSDGNNQYAEINGTRMDFSGSLVKAAALYAAFDLRSAARQHAKTNNFADDSGFRNSFVSAVDTSTAIQRLKDFSDGHKPILDQIFTGFKDTGPNQVRFKASFQTDLNTLENENAGRIIRALGYSYINVSMIRGKFFDPDPLKLNGIWLAGDYSGEAMLKSVRVPVENDTVAGGSGQAITTKQMSRMFCLVHIGKGFSNVADVAERTAANDGMHAILAAQGSFFFDANTPPFFQLTENREFSDHCAKVGIGRLGPIPTPGPGVFSEGAVMKWSNDVERTNFNQAKERKLTGDFAVCWQNMYRPDAHFDTMIRILNTSIRNFLTQ